MMTCQISVTNKFRSIQFFLFQEPPEIQNGPSDQIFSTMYQASDRVYPSQDGSSTAQFQVQNTCYAISGSLKHGPYPRIITNDSRMVRLGPGGSVLALTAPDYALTWNDAAVGGRQCANNGAFQLITDDTIPTNINQNYIGVGSADPNRPGSVVPTAVYIAEPNLNSILFPKMTFYVGIGEYEPGQLVDRTMLGKYVKIDFEGCRIPEAALVLEQDGSWVDNNGQSSQNGIEITQM